MRQAWSLQETDSEYPYFFAYESKGVCDNFALCRINGALIKSNPETVSPKSQQRVIFRRSVFVTLDPKIAEKNCQDAMSTGRKNCSEKKVNLRSTPHPVSRESL